MGAAFKGGAAGRGHIKRYNGHYDRVFTAKRVCSRHAVSRTTSRGSTTIIICYEKKQATPAGKMVFVSAAIKTDILDVVSTGNGLIRGSAV